MWKENNYEAAYYGRGTAHAELGHAEQAGQDMVKAARPGEAKLHAFADSHNLWRNRFEKVEAEIMGEGERDWAVTPDLTSWLE